MQDHFITKSIRRPYLPDKNAVFANKYLHFSFIATKKSKEKIRFALSAVFSKRREELTDASFASFRKVKKRPKLFLFCLDFSFLLCYT
jgi:hypothetical protein